MSFDLVPYLREKWINGGCGAILAIDLDRKDHKQIYHWVIDCLDGKIAPERLEDLKNKLWHALNFDVPEAATGWLRAELIEFVRDALRAG